jgi:hypothetical protein
MVAPLLGTGQQGRMAVGADIVHAVFVGMYGSMFELQDQGLWLCQWRRQKSCNDLRAIRSWTDERWRARGIEEC